MTPVSRYASCLSLSLFVAIFAAGCHGNQNQANTNLSSPDQSQDQAQDPTSANLAPISNASTSAANAPQDTSGAYSDQGAPSSGPEQQYSDQQYQNEPGYGEEAADTAPEPPPPLPEYDQPECPGDDYIWTPGYWSYASDGYYWVPGAWVEAPYDGALWTPGYWGYDSGHRHYAFYRGYWGPHIGYYGGINYGFGYVGFGYQGGYWNRGHFDYNRSVNRVNVNQVHYVYNHAVVYKNTFNTRISYNGGSGGINVRPRPAELAAIHEQHAPPMTAQVQHAQQARTDRANFAAVNHGRPANVAVTQPLAADHNIRPPAQIAARNAGQQQPQRAPEPMRPTARPSPEPVRQNGPNRPMSQPNGQPRNQAPPQQNNHQANQPQERAPLPRPAPPHAQPPQARPEPQFTRPQPSQPARPLPQPQPERTPPQRTEPTRPVPQPGPQRSEPARPAVPARPAAPEHAPPPSRPAPQQSQPKPPEHRPDDKHPQ
ncbi:MAG TPA: hypothetical protein VMR02_17805 [Terracidiphilus sp.]|nr:hypothetical protein [Terracidiphilus sp.]